jgi:antirestriction protein ArdC
MEINMKTTTKKSFKKPTSKKVNIYEIITSRVIEALENGVIPWKKGWNSSNTPRNYVSEKEYRGMNLISLGCVAFENPYFLTFKQIKDLGGKLKKGAKSIPIVFWKPFEVENEDGKDETRFLLRYSNVFSFDDTEGLKEKTLGEPTIKEFSIQEGAEEIINTYSVSRDAKFGGDRAFYSLSDFIQMPKKEFFFSEESFYKTFFHEMVHSTGHKKRLDRIKTAKFGSHEYSCEELVAEIGAVVIGERVGLAQDMENSVSYITGWVKALKNQPKMLLEAASKAEKAVSFIWEECENKSKQAC